MRVYLLLFSSALALMGTDQAPPTRIISTSLCGDGYVTSMTVPKNILALSWQSGDEISSAAPEFRGRAKAWDDIERLLTLKPDLVVFGPGEGQIAKPLLGKSGIKHVSLIWGEDFKAVANNEKILAEAFGLQEKPIHIPAPKSENEANKPSVLYLSSSGGSAGTGTYVDAAIDRAGGVNIISKSGWHTPDPEILVALKPDLIITSFFKDGYVSINEAGLRNKVLQDKIGSTARVNIPGKLWPCAGPHLNEAAALIATAIADLP